MQLTIGFRRWSQFVRARVAVAFALIALTSSVGHAELSVKAVAAGVRVEAKDARVEEIMARLRSDTGLRYRSSTTLDRRVTGTYEGPLLQVLARVLSSYDYIIKNDTSALEVVVVDFNNTSGRTATQKAVDPVITAPPAAAGGPPVQATPAAGGAPPAQAAAAGPATGGPAAGPPDFGQAVSAAAAPSAMPPQDPTMQGPDAGAPGSRPPAPMVGGPMAPVASNPNANGPRPNPGPR